MLEHVPKMTSTWLQDDFNVASRWFQDAPQKLEDAPGRKSENTRFFSIFGMKMPEHGRKMTPRWLQDGPEMSPTWPQDGTNRM